MSRIDKSRRNRKLFWTELFTTWSPLILSLPLAFLIIFGVGGLARVVLSFPFVLFFPGYTLILALFPTEDDLDGIERVSLSFGLSIAVVPLLGLILNYTPWGIRLNPIIITLLIFILLMSLFTCYRRKKLSTDKLFYVDVKIQLPQLEGMSRLDKALSVILVAAILFAAGSVYYVAATPKVGEKFTEFYILGPGGKAEGYPHDLKSNKPQEVILGVVNHEYQPVDYRAEVHVDNSVVNTLGPFVLDNEEKLEETVSFKVYGQRENQKVEFLLYKDDESEPYRSLHLWVNVSK